MRHLKRKFTLDRKKAARRALLLSLMQGLLKYKKIRTTLAKAKYCQMNIEKILNWAKNDTLANRRKTGQFFSDKKLISSLFKEIGPKLKERKSGFTRVTKLKPRQGDNASMAQLELLL